MKPTTNNANQRKNPGRTIRIGNDDWKRLDTIAKQNGMTRHGFIVNTIKKIIVEATNPELFNCRNY